MAGDLGSLGDATLNFRQVSGILDLLLHQLRKWDTNQWPLQQSQRSLLELIARYMSCSQRIYLSLTELAEWGKDPIQFLVSQVEEDKETMSDYPVMFRDASTTECPFSARLEVYKASPFVSKILQPLCPCDFCERMAINGEDERISSYLSTIWETGHRVDTKAVIFALRAIASCASFVPSGAYGTGCRPHQYWCDLNDGLFVQTCSIFDLVLLIKAVSFVLEYHGGVAADEGVQLWCLICLQSLTRSTAVLQLLLKPSSTELQLLVDSWRSVWSILLRVDLAYRSYTGSVGNSYRGKMVLQLLAEMIRMPCLDCYQAGRESDRRSGFRFTHQGDIWALPVFAEAGSKEILPYILIYTVLSVVGLSDDTTGPVASSSGLLDSSPPTDLRLQGRWSLLQFCRGGIQNREPSVLPFVAVCLGAIVHGVAPHLTAIVTLAERSTLPMLVQYSSGEDWDQVDTLLELWAPPDVGMMLERRSLMGPFDQVTSQINRVICQYEANVYNCNDTPTSFVSESLSTLLATDFYSPLDRRTQSTLEKILLAKVYLSVVMSSSAEKPSVEADCLTRVLNAAISGVLSDIAVVCLDCKLFWEMFHHLSGITSALSTLSSRGHVKLDRDTVLNLASLVTTCASLLEHPENEDVGTPPINSQSSQQDDLFDDSDGTTDSLVKGPAKQPSTRKRKRPSEPGPSDPQFSPSLGAPNLSCAFLVAHILLTLDPSERNIERARRSLMGVDSLDGDHRPPNEVGAAVIAHLCVDEALLCGYALHLVCADADKGLSPSETIRFVCNVIAILRANAAPDSPFHMFGYTVLSSALTKLDRCTRLPSLDKKTVELLALLLYGKSTRDDAQALILSRRPRLHARQINASVAAFRTRHEDFHIHSDLDFARTVVLPAVVESSGLVRNAGAFALGAALSWLSVDRVVASVQRRQPLLACNDKERQRELFAYRQLVAGETYKALSDQVWEDNFASIRFSVVYGWVRLAKASSSWRFRASVVHDLIWLSSVDPALEALCYQAAEEIAVSVRAKCVVSFLEPFMEYFIPEWLSKGNGLHNLPLLICAPGVLKMILRSRNLSVYCEDSTNGLARIRQAAADEFVSKQSIVVLPSIIRQFVQTCTDETRTRDWRRSFMGYDGMKEICLVFEDRFNDDVVLKLLRYHVHAIVADVCWLSTGSKEDKMLSSAIDRLVTSILPDVHSSHRLVFRTLRTLMETRRSSENMRRVDRFIASVANVAGFFEVAETEDVIVSSYMELLLLAGTRLYRQLNTKMLGFCWSAVEAMLALILNHTARESQDKIQVQQCFNFLSSVLEDHRFSSIHGQVVSTVVPFSKEQWVTPDLLISITRTVFHVMHINHLNLLRHCKLEHSQWNELLQRDVGIVGIGRLSNDSSNGCFIDSVSGSISDYADTANQVIFSTLDACDSMLENMLGRHETRLALGNLFINSETEWRNYCDLHPSFGVYDKLSAIRDSQQEALDAPAILCQFMKEWGGTALGRELSVVDESRLVNDIQKVQDCFRLVQEDDDVVSIAAQVLATLKCFCVESFPQSVRLASYRSIGEATIEMIRQERDQQTVVGTIDRRLQKAIKRGDKSVLRLLQARCLEALVLSLSARNSEVGVVAMDTLKALLSTRVGDDCCQWIEDSEVNDLIKLFRRTTGKANFQALLLDEGEAESVRSRHAFGSVEPPGDDWCWDGNIWSGPAANELVFDDWICIIVPAIIICSYRGQAGQKDDFFRASQRMCCLDPRFSTQMFAAIVLDLIERKAEPNGNSEAMDAVMVDTLIGLPGSAANANLSRCFTSLFDACTVNHSTRNAENQRCLSVAIDILDILRQVTEYRFNSSRSHKKNSSKRKCQPPDSSEYEYKTRVFERAIPWRGPLAGVVLRLDGVSVAKACLSCGRGQSALQYLDLYAENRFSGSSIAREIIQRCLTENVDFPGTADISGFPSEPELRRRSGTIADTDRFLATLRDAYAWMEELDASNSVDQFIADTAVLSERTAGHLFENRQPTSSMARLQMLDSAAGSSSPHIQCIENVTNALHDNGLRFILSTYLAGVRTTYSEVLTGRAAQDISTKWHESQLLDLASNLSSFQQELSRSGILSELQSTEGACFYASSLRAIAACLNDDISSCSVLIDKARKDDLTKFSGSVKQTKGPVLFSMVDRSKSLNYLHRYALSRLDSNEPATEAFTLTNVVREVTLHDSLLLKDEASKVRSNERIGRLEAHLWKSYESELEVGNIGIAAGILRRLQSTLSVFSSPEGTWLSSCSRLRLEEARILERSGDFRGAIRSLQQTVQRLKRVAASREQDLDRLKTLRAESFTFCGKLMSTYKVEPASSVLQEYLSPGLVLAKELMDSNASAKNVDRTVDALLQFSNVAVSIYDTVTTRIRSHMWQESEERLKDRLQELRQCQEMVIKESNGSTGSCMSDKDIHDLNIYCHRLKTEVDRARAERNKILESRSSNQVCIVHCIVRALSLMRPSKRGRDGNELSSHVYRMIDMWFTAVEDGQYDDKMDDEIEFAINHVPSFRFVSLSSQLFSRVDSGDPSYVQLLQFQKKLQDLVVKLCLEHPYHCLIHLVSLLNATNVGSGVNGRGADTFLENAGKGRTEAGQGILSEVIRRDPTFTQQLMENYMALGNAYVHLAMTSTKGNDMIKDESRILYSTVCNKASQRLDLCLGRKGGSPSFTPCIFTKPPPVRVGCDYGNGETDPIGGERVKSFAKTFSLTEGGVHAPKIVICIGSMGNEFKQLVKGEDEIRQDAVMQQVFGYANELMTVHSKSIRQSHRPKLKLVTYTIVPLTPSSGVSNSRGYST